MNDKNCSCETCRQREKLEIIDYSVLAKQENEAKVCLLLKANDFLPFPKNQEELSVTISMTMAELGNTIKNLVFLMGSPSSGHGNIIIFLESCLLFLWQTVLLFYCLNLAALGWRIP